MASGQRALVVTIEVPYNDNADYVDDPKRLESICHDVRLLMRFYFSQRTHAPFDGANAEVTLTNK